MPWPTQTPMSQRLEFIHAVLHRAPGESIIDICRQIGISEKTGHKWLTRFGDAGPAALADRSHAPHQPAHQVPVPIAAALCQLREAQPTWGARKLRDVLAREQPTVAWPAPSTITSLLTRAGLVTTRRRSLRERSGWLRGRPLTPAAAPNDVWTADFKGEFRLGSGPYCYPLTIADLSSRYLLAVTGLAGTATETAEAVFRRCFAEVGLPRVIRTDNGVPFAAPGALGGLSVLSVWWIRLGIRPERIEKGVPQQNGAHERMHRTLKAEATRPPSSSWPAQQARFDEWRRTFNERRPHEALQNTPPATHYTASPRALPRRLPPIEYPRDVEVRRVMSSGELSWQATPIFLSKVLRGEYVALRETAEAEWTVLFGPLTLGTYSLRLLAFVPQLAWTPWTPTPVSPDVT
jgi:putative transposase